MNTVFLFCGFAVTSYLAFRNKDSALLGAAIVLWWLALANFFGGAA